MLDTYWLYEVDGFFSCILEGFVFWFDFENPRSCLLTCLWDVRTN